MNREIYVVNSETLIYNNRYYFVPFDIWLKREEYTNEQILQIIMDRELYNSKVVWC